MTHLATSLLQYVSWSVSREPRFLFCPSEYGPASMDLSSDCTLLGLYTDSNKPRDTKSHTGVLLYGPIRIVLTFVLGLTLCSSYRLDNIVAWTIRLSTSQVAQSFHRGDVSASATGRSEQAMCWREMLRHRPAVGTYSRLACVRDAFVYIALGQWAMQTWFTVLLCHSDGVDSGCPT